MNDLVILHLSDLHIDDTGKSYSKLHGALLADIKTQIASISDNKLVIVVTGDIINMGNIKAIGNAKKFFKRLKEITDKKLKAIYIVPGNHDKKRTPINAVLVPTYRSLINETKMDFFGSEFEERLWPLQEETYVESGYKDLIEYIYDQTFNMQEIGLIVKKTYGVHILQIDDKKYCFIMLNTAWSCADDFDTRQLILGKFQLDEIGRQFHDLTDEEQIEMTFVMGHHPIESLHGIEQDALFSHMISYTEISANAYLCGHTHDRTVINWSNNRHAIHTLMTGFGWPEKPSDRVHDHYYSMYMFNLNLNSMDIYVRKTNDGSDFISDLSIYTGKTGNQEEKLVRPIRFQESQGAIALSTAKNIHSKTIYASKDFFQYSKMFLAKTHEIALDIGINLGSYKKDLCDNLFLGEDYDEEHKKYIRKLLGIYLNDSEGIDAFEKEQRELIVKVMGYNSDKIFDNFQSFIQRLCQKLHEGLVEEAGEGKIVRFHFRYLSDKSTSNYSTLCSSFSALDKMEEEENKPSDVKFGDLLEAAFLNPLSSCLIYSINEKTCENKLKDKWKDFITVIPKFDNNVYTKKVNKQSVKKYPYITFGVTINDSFYDGLLQCMDFYSMDQYIGNLLQSYVNTFMVDIDAFLNWLKSDDRMEAK